VRDMDARQLQTLRLIEGGKYNVNLRRLKAAGPASAQPVTANLWVVLEGGGTLTTGGALGAGKINGGRTRVLQPGDLVYLPSGLPHGVTSVNGNLTFLDVRWDTDWPADSPMGAGTLTGLTGGTPAPRAGAAPPPRVPLPAGSQQALPFSYGGSGEVFFARETLDELMAGMRVRKSINTRLIEGGRYNINLRWNGTPTMEIHERTIDTWFLLAGNATVNTGNQVANDARVANTGVFNPAKPGDVFFIPSNLHHGYSDVSPDVFWLNIRWDDNYKKD
jgi:mannose-6-phosphate isomerase-like protein (cupin superfamily)